ncbi:MAG: hypothetical protein PHF86_11060 [Candidatus Nanoarchaeia archaeon]|nr:hypothetical protein [Candidatus Nanoarchaeia archaeon]
MTNTYIINLKKILIKNPKNAIILGNIAASLNNSKNFKEALKYINKSLKINPHSIHNLRNKVNILLNLKKNYEANKILNLILKKSKNDMYALHQKIYLNSKIVRSNEKILILKKMWKLKQKCVNFHLLNLIFKNEDKNRKNVLLKYAKVLYNFDPSFSIPLLIIKKDYFNKYPTLNLLNSIPLNKLTPYDRAIFNQIFASKMEKEGKIDEAIKHYILASFCPKLNRSYLYYKIADNFMKKEKYITATKYYLKSLIIRKKADNFMNITLFRYAEALFYAKKYVSAKNQFRKLIKINGNQIRNHIKKEALFYIKCIDRRLYPPYIKTEKINIFKDIMAIKDNIQNVNYKLDLIHEDTKNNNLLIKELINKNPDKVYYALNELIKQNRIKKQDINPLKKILNKYNKISDVCEKTEFWIKKGIILSKYLASIISLLN